MKFLPFAAALMLAACASTTTAPPVPSAEALLGSWKVDLRPTPAAPGYYKTFVVTNVEDRSFAGTFYDTPFEAGRLNTDWGALRFAFVTEDRSGAYHHAGVLRDGKIEGTTHSIGRARLSYWSAVRP